MGGVHLTRLAGKLAACLLLSSLALLAARPGASHEVRPAIADIEVGADALRLEIELALEPLVAGMDLAGLDDTDNAPEAEARRYDRLRALPPDALEAAFRDAWPDLRDGLRLRSGAETLAPALRGVEIPEAGDLTLPRDSRIVLEAALPRGRAPVIFGWAPEYGPVVLRQQGVEQGYTGYLTDGADSTPIPRGAAAEDSALAAFGRYILIGFDHIVPKGLDHILFVLGLFFFSLQMRPLIYQVSAFTVAHTVTLALAVLGIVTVPAAIVEPLIALSIAYVAVENVVFRELKPWRTAVVFGFGLLHGIGFATILGEIGLSPGRFLAGLIGFNIGVELGQLAVLLGAWGMLGIWFGGKPWYRARIAIPASLAIAAVGVFWFVERVGLIG
jgi:hypothetical protein